MIKYKIIYDEDFDKQILIATTSRGDFVRILSDSELKEIQSLEKQCQIK